MCSVLQGVHDLQILDGNLDLRVIACILHGIMAKLIEKCMPYLVEAAVCHEKGRVLATSDVTGLCCNIFLQWPEILENI